MFCIRQIVTAFLALVISTLALAQPSTDIFLSRIQRSGDRITLEPPKNITQRTGYDNQPQFLSDSTGLLFTSNLDTQTDIFRYSLVSGETSRITNTPESEYSPTPTRDGADFTVIRVEADSTQRLWRFSLDGGNPTLVFPNVKPAGYHAWGFENTVVMFVLGDPPTLQIANTNTGDVQTVTSNIGRSIQKIPVQRAVSFVHYLGDGPHIDRYDIPTGHINPLTPPLEGVEDHAWMPDGTTILMAKDTEVFAWEPAGREWTLVGDFANDGISGITRLAVSPDGEWVAFVAAD